jgi:methionyl-tRNA formyltransferase
MKLVYLGTPDMAVPPLRALVDAGHDVVMVITRADKKRGRGAALSPSPVKVAATELGLAVSHDPEDALLAAEQQGAELGVVVAYGRIVKPHILERLPMINGHFSLLPRWRGAAPVERALLAGDEVTGVCVMALEATLDTGGVYACEAVPITSTTTAAELRDTLVSVCSDLLVERLSRPVDEWIGAVTPQVGEAVYAAKLTSSDLEIDWSAPAVAIGRQVRVGGAWTTFRGKRLKILAAAIVGERIVPTTVQPEGKRPMSFEAWRNGARPAPDELFGDR